MSLISDLNDVIAEAMAAPTPAGREQGYIDLLPIQTAILKRAPAITEMVIRQVPDYQGSILGKYSLIANPVVQGKPATFTAQIDFGEFHSPEWQRLAIVKEMCHCIWDIPEKSRVTSVGDLLTLTQGLVVTNTTPNFVPFQNDKGAGTAAMEILCPIAFRSLYIDKLAKGELSKSGVAEIFGIPTQCIDRLFERNYIDYMKSVFKSH